MWNVKIRERLETDEAAIYNLSNDVAEWHLEFYLDEDGHLNLLIRDMTEGRPEEIRGEYNVIGHYTEHLLRYTSDTVEDNYQIVHGDYTR